MTDGDEMNWAYVKDYLHDQVLELPANHNTRLATYYKALSDVFGQVRSYLTSKDYERAYVKLLTYVTFRLKTIAKHAQYGSPEYRIEKVESQKKAERCLELLEQLSDILQKKWDAPKPIVDDQSKEEEEEKEQPKPTTSSTTAVVGGTVAAAATAGAIAATTGSLPAPVSASLSTGIASTADSSAPLTAQNVSPSAPVLEEASAPSLNELSYPTIGAPRSISNDKKIQPATRRDGIDAVVPVPAVKPTKSKPRKKKDEFMKLFNQLRKVHVPVDAPWEFLRRVEANTRKDKETCGLLAGRLVNNEFYITHIILPKQKGTSNTVEMLEEDELMMVQLKYDLLTLGWIHTHPSQDCFLSSVDLHTHYSYQCLLPEAIAIVMAPSVRETCGTFTITPKGMAALKKCTLRGFHTDCQAGGNTYKRAEHSVMAAQRKCQFIDLR